MAKDIFHQAVKSALMSDGWTITSDPLTIRIDKVKLEVDLAAEKVIAAQKNGQRIAVEIKSFTKPSTINEFHAALGQFLNYRLALQITDPSRILYLAVPIDIFDTFFQERFIKIVILSYQLKLLIYNPNNQEITQWIN